MVMVLLSFVVVVVVCIVMHMYHSLAVCFGAHGIFFQERASCLKMFEK